MASPLKTEIMSAIGKTDDENLKMVLLLQLNMMEEIGEKIDSIYKDKELLRESVLNGHADVHHSDHEWIKTHREQDARRIDLLRRAEPVLLWAEQKIQDEKDVKVLNRNNLYTSLYTTFTRGLWFLAGLLVYQALPLLGKLFL